MIGIYTLLITSNRIEVEQASSHEVSEIYRLVALFFFDSRILIDPVLSQVASPLQEWVLEHLRNCDSRLFIFVQAPLDEVCEVWRPLVPNRHRIPVFVKNSINEACLALAAERNQPCS